MRAGAAASAATGSASGRAREHEGGADCEGSPGDGARHEQDRPAGRDELRKEQCAADDERPQAAQPLRARRRRDQHGEAERRDRAADPGELRRHPTFTLATAR